MNQTLHTKFGTAKIQQTGYYIITSVKQGNNGKKLHRLIFEDFYGEIPEGYVIHHKDENKTNNCIMNLQLMKFGEHTRMHHKGMVVSEETRRKISEATKGKNTGADHHDISGEKNPNYGKFGEKHHGWKNYARIVKKGKKKGKQLYGIMFNGELVKCSLYTHKLEIWFNKYYPNEKLVNKFGSD